MRNCRMLLLASLVVWGCQAKQKECDKLVGVINPIMAHFGEFADFNPQNIDQAQKALKTMASLSEECAANLDGVAFDTLELRSYADKYETMCAKVGEAATQMVAHLESQKRMQSEVQKLQSDLQDAGEKLEKACNAAEDAAACRTVGEKLERMPDDPVAQMATLKKLVGEIKAIEIEDPVIKDAVAEIVAAHERKVQLVEQTAKLEENMKATEEKIEAATADEESLVSGLNALCRS